MTINVIQGAKGRTSSAGSIASGAITTSAGSALIAVGCWDTGTFSSIVDSKSNTWTQIGSELTGLGGGSSRARIYYSELDAAKVGASHTVTFAQTGTSSMTVLVIEVGGGTIPGVFDKQAGVKDASSPFGSGATATTAQAIELLIGAMFGGSGSNPATHAIDSTSTPTSGWSITSAAEETNGVSFYPGGIANQRVTSTGAYQGVWTETGATDALVWTATFKEAAAGGAEMRAARIPNKSVGPAAQRYRFRRTTPLDTTVANAATTASDSFSSAAAATATFTTQSSAAVPFSSAGVATATFATASSVSTAFSSAGVATATFNAQSSAAVAFSSAGSATATFTTQSGAQSPLAAAGVATATFTTQSSVATPFAIAGVSTATFSTKAGASADFTMSGTATAIFTATTGASSTADAFMAGSATANFAAASLAPSAFTVSGQATVLFRGQAVTPNQRPYLQWGKRPPTHETYDEEILALSHAMGSYLIDMVEGRYVSKAKIKLGKKAH